MPTRVNWTSAPDAWPKDPPTLCASLRAALLQKSQPGKKRPPQLRHPWAGLLWAVCNLSCDGGHSPLFDVLRETFPEGADRDALLDTIHAQLDPEGMATDSQVWSRGPGSSEEGWLTPHHPGVEVACYGRLLLELGHQEDGRAALAQLHLARRAAVARFTDNPADPYAPQARLQQLDGWAAFVESKATGRFGFPRLQRWADKEVRIARTGKVGTTVPPL